jgi:hypothetical protein
MHSKKQIVVAPISLERLLADYLALLGTTETITAAKI